MGTPSSTWIVIFFVVIVAIIVAVLKSNKKGKFSNIGADFAMEFEAFYIELANSNNIELYNALEAVKQENSKKKKIICIACFIVDLLLLLVGINSYSDLGSVVPLIISGFVLNIFIIIGVSLIFSKKLREYNKKYKEIVISKVISNFYDKLTYLPEASMPENEYRMPGYEYYERYHSEDLFEAKINEKYDVKMAEILTEVIKEETDSEGNKTQTRETVFHGLFSNIILDKPIIDEFRIVPNGQLFFGQRTKMDSSLFEKYFDVKSSDKIKAMQILTADVMEEFIDIQNKLGYVFDLVIKGNNLYLRIHTGDMFEPGSLKGGMFNKELIQKYYFVLKFTYTISNRLIELIDDIS